MSPSTPLPELDAILRLIELGGEHGRTGARGVQQALTVAAAVEAAPELRLVGVGGYEGSLAHARTPDAIARVERYLDDIVAVHERGDLPVLWLTPEVGASLTLTGSSVVYSFSTDGGMNIVRNADNDAVFTPKVSAFDGSVVGSGGEVCVDDGSDYWCFQVKAVQP